MTSADDRTDASGGLEEPIELDAAFTADPHLLYPLLRSQRPVVRARSPLGMGIWLVTRYDDVRAALNDPRLSKDATGMRSAFDHQRHDAGQRVRFGQELTAHMLNSDPPDHTRLRRLVNRAFTVRAVAAMRPRVEAIAERLADAMAAEAGAGRHTVDLIDQFAFPLPMTVICEILGVPDGDRAEFRSWSNALLTNAPFERRRAAAEEMAGFLAELVEHKRAHPAEDMLSEIVRGTESSVSGTSMGTESSVSGTSMGTESSASGTSRVATGCRCARRCRWRSSCWSPGMRRPST